MRNELPFGGSHLFFTGGCPIFLWGVSGARTIYPKRPPQPKGGVVTGTEWGQFAPHGFGNEQNFQERCGRGPGGGRGDAQAFAGWTPARRQVASHSRARAKRERQWQATAAQPWVARPERPARPVPPPQTTTPATPLTEK
jgi:hypothetical protein